MKYVIVFKIGDIIIVVEGIIITNNNIIIDCTLRSLSYAVRLRITKIGQETVTNNNKDTKRKKNNKESRNRNLVVKGNNIILQYIERQLKKQIVTKEITSN